MTGGTVFDIGYQRYSGRREGRGRALRGVFRDGVRIALGLGRGGRAKILPWLFIGLLAAVGTVMALVAGAANLMRGDGAAEQMNLPTHADLYGMASIILYVFGAIVAPELLCRDRREGVIQLYLVRPLSGSDYVAARWAAFFVVMLASTWLPQVILFLGLSMGAREPMTYLARHWLDVPRFLVAGLAMAAYVTSLAMLTASFTTRRAYAAIFLVGLIVVSAPFTVGLAEELGDTVGRWISMFTLTNIPVHVNDLIFGQVSEVTEDAPAAELSAPIRVGWYLAWTIVPSLLLWWRYRRMTP